MIAIKIVFKNSYGEPCYLSVGEYDVINIEEHAARGEGDKWYYDVEFSSGKVERIFEFSTVTYKKTN